MNLESTEGFDCRVLLLINNNNNPEPWWSGLEEGFCILGRNFSLETEDSFDQDLFHSCEDAFPAERWRDILLDPLPAPQLHIF